MAVPDVNIDILKKEAADYNYVRFSWADLNGIPRCKSVPSRYVEDFLVNGMGCFTGSITMGARNAQSNIPIVVEGGCGNMSAMPACDHITPIPWSTDGEFHVGEIICEPMWIDGNMQEAGPRFVARKQINRLAKMGYLLYSAFEMECMIFEKDTLKPLTEGNDFTNAFSLSRYEKMLYEFDKKMQPCGVDIETFQCEYSPGQFEFSFHPKYGIETADMMYRFKQGMKEMAAQRGMHVTFMTRPFATAGCSNGTHFNHSLWDENGKNVFYNPQETDNLSDIARYYIGGIFKHIKGLTALCSPTINCYRRLHQPWAPDHCDWNIDDRTTSWRVKNTSEKGTYMENRLPSGSCNPYLVIAATLAAGIDGITKKLEPPPKGSYPDMESVPYTLQEALEELENDEVLCEALGKEFVEWYVMFKQRIDVKQFGDHDVKSAKPEEIEAERNEYFEFL